MITTLVQIAALFSLLSLLAFGGGSGVLPDMQRASVTLHHWLADREFLVMFALSRAAPGPGSLIVVLIGQKAAGLAGAAVAFVAMFGPSCLLVHAAARFWQRAGGAAWREVVEHALAPVGVGLTIGSGLALMQGTEHGWVAYAVTIFSTAAFAFTEIHPLMLLAAGGVLMLLAGR